MLLAAMCLSDSSGDVAGSAEYFLVLVRSGKGGNRPFLLWGLLPGCGTYNELAVSHSREKLHTKI